MCYSFGLRAPVRTTVYRLQAIDGYRRRVYDGLGVRVVVCYCASNNVLVVTFSNV